MQNTAKPFGLRDKIGYLFGDFGCNMSFQLISSYLVLFMTQAMGLSTQHWAIIILVAKIFDAINDPIIGALVDARKPSKGGKFRPWLFWGAIAIAVTTVLLFIDISAMPYWGRFAYCLIMYMVWSIAYTAANVPYGSLNAALTDDAGERAGLSSLRSIGAALAMIPVMVVIPLVGYGDKDANGIAPLKGSAFIWIALAMGLAAAAGLMITYFLTRERAGSYHAREKFNYLKTLKGFFRNRAALGMCLASFAQLVFILTYATTVPLVYQLYFKNTDLIAVASLVMMLPMLLLIPFMSKLTVKYGKKEISAFPNIIAIIVCVAMLFIDFPRDAAGAWIYTALLAVIMFAGGTFTLATWSMVADCVDEQELITGKREEGSVYATYSLSRKIAQGIGASLVMLCLGWAGYDAQNIGSITEAAAEGILKVSIIFPLIGSILIFLTLTFIYNLNRKRVERNTELLREKRANSEEVAVSFNTAIGEDGVQTAKNMDGAEAEEDNQENK